MAMISPAIRNGPLLALLAAAFAVAPATANAAQHHYTIRGSLSPVAQPQSASNGSLKLQSGFTSMSAGPAVQSGGPLVLMATLAYSPLVCFGDTIFRDGFDL